MRKKPLTFSPKIRVYFVKDSLPLIHRDLSAHISFRELLRVTSVKGRRPWHSSGRLRVKAALLKRLLKALVQAESSGERDRVLRTGRGHRYPDRSDSSHMHTQTHTHTISLFHQSGNFSACNTPETCSWKNLCIANMIDALVLQHLPSFVQQQLKTCTLVLISSLQDFFPRCSAADLTATLLTLEQGGSGSFQSLPSCTYFQTYRKSFTHISQQVPEAPPSKKLTPGHDTAVGSQLFTLRRSSLLMAVYVNTRKNGYW